MSFKCLLKGGVKDGKVIILNELRPYINIAKPPTLTLEPFEVTEFVPETFDICRYLYSHYSGGHYIYVAQTN